MKNKERILYELITKNMVEKSMFLLICSNRKSAWKVLRWLDRIGYIKETSITRTGRVSSTIDYITLTSSGFIYATSLLSRTIPWIQPASVRERYSALGGANGDKEKLEFYLRLTSAGILCDLIGGEENIHAPASDGERTRAAETNRHILTNMSDVIAKQFTPAETNPVRFYSVRNAKTQLAKFLEGKEQAFKQARLSGIYESPKRVAAVYVAFKNDPIVWYESHVTKEHAMTTTFKSRCLCDCTGRAFNVEAVYITPNAKTLSLAAGGITGIPSTRGFNKTASFGFPYTNMWIIETSHDAVADLRRIMTSDVDQEQQAWTEKIKVLEPLSPNSFYYVSLFPFVNERREYVTAWPYLTAQNLCKAQSFLNAFPDTRLKIYCKSWHIPYIQAFLGELVNTVVMPDGPGD